MLIFLVVFFSVGLHVDHVLPTVLEGQATGLHGDSPQPDAGQPSGRPALGARHVLPE